MPPTLYIKNTLRIAEMGLGDGTIYAGGSSAVIQQGNKRIFFVNYFQIGDLPTAFDDQFNGYFVYFPASGNKYHIVDFVSSDKSVTTWEVPATTDNGPCEVRRALVDNQALAGNPTHRLADGQKFAPWKSGTLPKIDIHLPNHIDDGGFEIVGLGKWDVIPIGGTSDASGINITSPLLGKRDFKLDLGDRSQIHVGQPLQRPLFKERKYRVLFKARYVGASFNVGDFAVSFRDTGNNSRPELPGWENPSSGTVSTKLFTPALTTSSAWHWADVVMRGEDVSGGFARLGFRILGNPITVYFDEVYLFERVNVDSLIVFDHDSYHSWTIRGRYCAKDRTGVVNGIDESTLVTNQTVLKDPYIHEFTGGIFPVYELENAGASIPQASEMLLGEKWAWQHGPNRPISFDAEEYSEKTFTSRSGVEHTIRHSQRRTFSNTYPSMPEVDRLRLIGDWKTHHRDDLHPFAVKLEVGDTPILMIDVGKKFDNPYNNIQPDWAFKFKEVK